MNVKFEDIWKLMKVKYFCNKKYWEYIMEDSRAMLMHIKNVKKALICVCTIWTIFICALHGFEFIFITSRHKHLYTCSA